jgi:hypothetical protein
VRGLNVAYIEIVISEDGATHRVYQDSPVLDAKIDYGFGNELVKNAVTATRTIVGCFNVLSLAFEYRKEGWGFAMRDLPHAPSPSSRGK